MRPTDAGQLDLAGLNLDSPEPRSPIVDEPPPKITVSREKVLEEARKALEGKDEKKGVSLVVIGKILLLGSHLRCSKDHCKVMSMRGSRP